MVHRTLAHAAIADSFSGPHWGYIPDDDRSRAQSLPASLFFRASVRIPTASVSLGNFEGAILNQGQTGSCVGHGASQLVTIASNASGVWLPIPSPRLLYALARILRRSSAADGLTDSGADPTALLTALRMWGVAPMSPTITPDGRRSDVWGPSDLIGLPTAFPNVNVEPALSDLEAAGNRLLTGEYRIDETDPTYAEQIAQSLGMKAPAGVGLFVDTAFMNWDPRTGPVRSINLDDPKGAGHFLACSYAYTDSAGEIVLGGANSWGAEWPINPGPVPGSPFWTPGHWEITASGLQPAMADCLLFPIKVVA